MDRNRISCILSITAGALFVIAAFTSKNMVFMPIGLCFVILGIVNGKKDK